MFNKCPPDPLPDEHLKVAIVKQCEENNLEGTEHFLSKVQQLYDMMDLSDGVMLLGKIECEISRNSDETFLPAVEKFKLCGFENSSVPSR